MVGARTTFGGLRGAVMFCALAATTLCAVAGCADFQPTPAASTGGGVFASPPIFTEPGPAGPRSAGTIAIAPTQITAPVGSEVILVASVADRAGQPATDRRVEWMIGSGSVGEFVTIADRDAFTLFGLFGVSGKKISPTYMMGATSPRNVVITRGTPTTMDDIRLAPGQTWASVTSPAEGITAVTVFSPDVYPWDQRQRTATIQWVGATAMPAGTLVSPMGGPGVLAPAPTVQQTGPGTVPPTVPPTIPTLPMNPSNPGAPLLGTRPPTTPPAGVSGTMANMLEVRVTGPSSAEVGADVQFTIEVFNRGSAKATGLVASDRYDVGFKHAVATGPIERPLEDIAPGQSRRFNVTFNVVQQGQWCHTVDVTSKEGGRATGRACLSATPAPVSPQARLKIVKTGPASVRAGETAEFFITITNTSGTQLVNLRLSDTYGDSLEPIMATDGFVPGRGELVWTIPSLAAGQSVRRQVNCRARTPGRSSNRATITDSQGNTAADEVAIDIQ